VSENLVLIRRSNLLVPITDAAAVRDAWRHNADAITLDLLGKGQVRGLLKEAVTTVGQAAAEVFVRVDKSSLRESLGAAVIAGVRGIVLQVESADEVRGAAEIVTSLERERSVVARSLSFIVQLGTARGVWDIRAIVTASPRVTQAALDEAALATSLGIAPVAEIDPFEYARGRLVVESIAAKVSPVGMAWPLGAMPRDLPPGEIQALAAKSKNLGMKGVICPFPQWVAPVNAAFTPTPELVTWNKRVREAFAAGVAAGTAAVPLDGRMIDVPVDEWAIVVIAMAEACAKRDAEKAAAIKKLQK
jgi:citrate lyase subunit beta/citryl-CoA lyase